MRIVHTAFLTDFERLQATAVSSLQGARQFSVVPNGAFRSALPAVAGPQCSAAEHDVSALCQVELRLAESVFPIPAWPKADADGVLAAHRIGEFNEYAVLEAWVAGSIGTFVDSPTNELPSVNPSFRLRGSK